MRKPVSWHTLESFEVLEHQDVDYKQGLDPQEAARRQRLSGPNTIRTRGSHTTLHLIKTWGASPLVLLLVIGGGLLFTAGHFREAGFLIILAGLDYLLETLQFRQRNRILSELRRFHAGDVRVRRGGHVKTIPAERLVPGDVILLEAGDIVPADARLIESANLRAQEALLTGEFHPVGKVPQAMQTTQVPTGAHRNLVFMGTKITHGRGQAVVVATGMQTELGRIATLLQPENEHPTPLLTRLRRLEWMLGEIFIASILLMLALGFLHSDLYPSMAVSIANLAISTAPAGLPFIIFASLSVGARRIYLHRAFVQRKSTVEALGAISVICTDKPGTLTENQIDLTLHSLEGEEQQLIVNTSGNHPIHHSQDKPARPISPSHALLLSIAVLSSNAEMGVSGEDDGDYLTSGDPAEGVLLVAAARHGLWKSRLERLFPRVIEAPYSPTHPRNCSLHTARLTPHLSTPEVPLARFFQEGYAYVACVKGSLPALLRSSTRIWLDGEILPLSDEWKTRIEADYFNLIGEGSHVLAIALRPLTRLPALAEDLELPLQGFPAHLRDLPMAPADVPKDERAGVELERDLILLGMVRVSDSPRAEVRQAVMACRQAGIRLVMMTADQPQAAIQAARRLHILEAELPQVLTGDELAHLSETELDRAVERVSIYAGLSPEHKLQIVEALQRRGHVVAITGTSVNEAPALRKSDVGFAMGINGTEVSKQAAQVVVLDDSFATIVRAISEGRQVYSNLRRYLTFVLIFSLAQVLLLLGMRLMNIPNPYSPGQLLWVNLLVGILPGFALAARPPGKDLMRQPPAPYSQDYFGKGWWVSGIRTAVVLSMIGLTLVWSAQTGGDPAWQTFAFCLLGALEISLAVSLYFRPKFDGKKVTFRILAAAALGAMLLLLIAVAYPPLSAWLALPPLPYRDVLIVALAGLGFYAWSEVDLAIFRVT